MFRVTLALAAAFLTLPISVYSAESVEGHVFDLKTGAAVRDVQVNLLGPSKERVVGRFDPLDTAAQVLTDASGAFAFRSVAPGNYVLMARRSGYQLTNYGKIGAGMEAIAVSDGKPARDIVIKLAPCGAIAGRVVDEAGQPLANARITVYQYIYGHWMRRPAAPPTTQFVYTDDRGQYRAFGVLPGQYVISAAYPYELAALEPRATPGQGHKTTYYPDAAGPGGARPVTVASGETAAIDFTLRKGPAFRLQGTVAGVGQGTQGSTCVGLTPEGVPSPGFLMVGSVGGSGGLGGFEIVALPPGRYSLTATCAGPNGQPVFGKRIVDLTGDTTGLLVETTPAWQMHGTLKLAGKADLSAVSVNLTAVELNRALRAAKLPAGGGPFTLDNALPVTYVVELRGLPANCYVRSILYGGKEVPAGGFAAVPGATLEISLGVSPASGLTGTVVDAAGKPEPYPVVFAFPADGAAASITQVMADRDGHFAFPALRPGPYKVAAWDNIAQFPVFAARDAGMRKLFESNAKSVRPSPGTPRAIRLTAIASGETEGAEPGQ